MNVRRARESCVGRRRLIHDTGGMTLMELVVALAVAGLALAAGYGAFASVVDQRARAEAAADAVLRAAAGRAALVAWLSGARLAPEGSGVTFRGLDASRDGVPDDEVSFMTTAPTPLGAADVLVRLAIDRDTATAERGLVAEFAEWRGPRTARLEVEPHATGLDVRYTSSLVSGRGWLPSWISTTVLPAGVRLTVLAARPDSLPELLRLPVVARIGGGR